MNTKKQARLEILSQNRKDLQTQVARIKQTLEKVFDKDTSLADCFNNRPCYSGVFGGGGGGAGGYPSKDKGTLRKWLDRLADALKRLAGRAAEAFPVIVGSVVGAILSFLGKAVGFIAEHTWALIVFAAGLIGIRLMQKVQRK